MTRVKNAVGSSRFPAPSGYSSWLDYWERQTGESATSCGRCGMFVAAEVGAHVQKADGTDKRNYITPLCRRCNQRTDEFYVTTQLVPVPSNL